MSITYLDTSAFLKLVVAEHHSAALRADAEARDLWSSQLLDIEAHRAGRRLGLNPDAVQNALRSVTLITPALATFAGARTVGPDALRTLDALHLAAALELGSDLAAVLSYDRRLAGGCEAAGIEVHAPGLPPRWWTEAADEPSA